METVIETERRTRSWESWSKDFAFSAYCIVAAFTTYFSMYAFRTPFKAATFDDVQLWGRDHKVVLVVSQVIGYTISKFLGIKFVSEMPRDRRVVGIVSLIVIAEVALLLFAITPPPWNFVWLFVNGLPLGMVFGLVLSFLEGRRMTETLSAGLCISFIFASGVMKDVGALLLQWGVAEYWMPFTAGLVFFVPFILGVAMLAFIPLPSASDIEARSERFTMDRVDRSNLFRKHCWGLMGLIAVYVLLSVIRSMRDDFGVEIWQDLGYEKAPRDFTYAETWVCLIVIISNGVSSFIRKNRMAFLSSLVLILVGLTLSLYSLYALQQKSISPFTFMVLVGVGTYIPYVAFHTTVFERLIAAFRERGNLGYLMYLADSLGYLGYTVVMISKNSLPLDRVQIDYRSLFTQVVMISSVIGITITCLLWLYYWRTVPHDSLD